MKTKQCPNCKANVPESVKECLLCKFDLSKEYNSQVEIHTKQLKQLLKPSDSSSGTNNHK